MAVIAESKAEGAGVPSRVDVRIAVENFGPIEKGEVELRPLTIFVGASNTGKTYFSVLIYSLHNTLEGFSRIPVVGRQVSRLLERFVGSFVSSGEERAAISREAEELGDKLGMEDQPLRFSDLPERAQEEAKKTLLGSDGAVEDLIDELRRCFDLPSASGLIRAREGIDRARVSLGVQEGMGDLWGFDATVSASGCVVAGEIEDMVLVPARGPKSELGRRLEQIAAHLEAGQYPKALAELPHVIGLDSREAYYLPAARSGIIQSHRVIASSIMARATRAGLERLSELPTFPGPLADFMQQLIDHRGRENGFRRAARRSETVQTIAGDLENGTLGGEILVQRRLPGGYPEFLYRPRDATQNIGLGQASSMVTELAPMVLLLRDGMGVGDTLIVEEPEAHLHPAAQTEMAYTLARLVNAGVRVVATTHSDWLLKAFANLMREGEFNETTGGFVDESSAQGRLRPEDVGVWLFRKGLANGGSTVDEIPFDRIEGIEPSDYEDIAEELYNRSAELQNRLAEANVDGNPE
ncbi:MAG: AAA family ATPase [Candidatus Dadabacteria bacterium]|nr:AAA family ATPase [Candidatus Dadabacteria bacterium]MDE0274671.1 AAA family ATPase [Defluviicoccus sp.]